MSAFTDEDVERAARALCQRHRGNPDWPVGLDHQGFHQEPYVSYVPAWKWFYEADARIALTAGASRVVAERDALKAALEPFAACVFNDNGDLTITMSDLHQQQWLAAKQAMQTWRAAPHLRRSPRHEQGSD